MTGSKSDHQSRGAQTTGAQNKTGQRSTLSDPRQPVLPFVAPQVDCANPQEGNLATPINSSKLTRWALLN